MKYPNKKNYLEIKLNRLREEDNNRYLLGNNYLHKAIYRNCKREVVSYDIKKGEELSKTLFNRKNILWICKVYHILKDTYYNFYICTECFIILNN